MIVHNQVFKKFPRKTANLVSQASFNGKGVIGMSSILSNVIKMRASDIGGRVRFS